jgi:adenosylcobinamide-phosphate synthase
MAGNMVLSLVTPLTACAAVLIDRLVGEPRRWHPLVGFGLLAAAVERRLNRRRRSAGVVAWAVVLLPLVALAEALRTLAPLAVDVTLLTFALGARSLAEHAEAVRAPLAQGALEEARRRVGCIVSRDTGALDEAGVSRAAVESVLENGNDAVFGALFWFAILGGPGALLFRLANTLDAMWGYRTERFEAFGWAAARADDVLNWIPARLTAVTYALLGSPAPALACWRRQAPAWDSPNAGPVMAAGAGSLGLALGGPASYHGVEEERPPLGYGAAPRHADIARAVTMVDRGVWLWLSVLLCLGVLRA